ncbi:MAG TPA: GntR family transcriptional regulator [Thermoproteales archaeon]|nr:MAG: hypothetical protein DRN81_00900 [Candidatus Korarchaeota archaeon]HDH07214.1 GntR family transcriptional regulator [Thermoproteales archaeon]
MSSAIKVRISDIYAGRFEEVTVNGIRLFRLKTGISTNLVRIMGVVVNSYINPDETYAFVTLDDTTGVIDVKAWHDSVNMLLSSEGEVYQTGTILDVIGKVRMRDENLYVTPTLVIRVEDPNWITVRRLEILRLKLKYISTSWATKKLKDRFDSLKDRLLEEITNKYPDGVTLEELETKTKISRTLIRQALDDLAEEGLLYVDGDRKYRITSADAYEQGSVSQTP